jgi:hypothetical protein
MNIMGMETSACHADIVDESFVKEISPIAFKRLKELVDNAENGDFSMELLSMTTNYEGDIEGELAMDLGEEDACLISNAYNKLQIDFQNKSGLSLDLKYHAKEDRGDEVDGYFWAVGCVYELSAAGKKYNKEIERKYWTVWG